MPNIVRGKVNVTFDNCSLRAVANGVSGFSLKEVGGTTGTTAAGTGSYLHQLIAIPMSIPTSAGLCNILLADGGGGTVNVFGTVLAGTTTAIAAGTFIIPIGAVSQFGPWRVTTQGGVRVTAIGKFL